jgi:hypothetical protein
VQWPVGDHNQAGDLDAEVGQRRPEQCPAECGGKWIYFTPALHQCQEPAELSGERVSRWQDMRAHGSPA